MSDRPWYPWYPGNFRAKTGLLDASQKGAYRELLDEIYLNRKGLPDDDKRLAKVCFLSSKKWQSVRPHLEPFFVIQDGYWYHKTAHEVMTQQKLINQSFSERGRLGALKRWGKKNDNRIDSLANSLAINGAIARPMANIELNIKAFGGEVNNLHVQQEKLNSTPFIKKPHIKKLTPEQRQQEIEALQAFIAELDSTGKTALANEQRIKLETIKASI